jgi:toxin ParE1/3/4
LRVELSASSRLDIRDIQRYIANDNPLAGKRMAQRLLAACMGLADFPHRGRHGRVPSTRELASVRPYIIVYSIKPNLVEIIRIRHAAQARSAGLP